MARVASAGHVGQPPASPPGGHDPRTSSIQALRMRAKEYVETVSKNLQQQQLQRSSPPGLQANRDDSFVPVSWTRGDDDVASLIFDEDFCEILPSDLGRVC